MRERVPFLMRFAEPVNAPTPSVRPRYDETRDISVVTEGGEEVPFVTADVTGTRTFTEVRGETTDQDYQTSSQAMSTQTVTKARGESTDSDRTTARPPSAMGTQTITFTRGEATDAD